MPRGHLQCYLLSDSVGGGGDDRMRSPFFQWTSSRPHTQQRGGEEKKVHVHAFAFACLLLNDGSFRNLLSSWRQKKKPLCTLPRSHGSHFHILLFVNEGSVLPHETEVSHNTGSGRWIRAPKAPKALKSACYLRPQTLNSTSPFLVLLCDSSQKGEFKKI